MVTARAATAVMFAAGILAMSPPVNAQTPEPPAAPPASAEAAAVAAPPPGPAPEVMTIFGRRKPGTYPGWARIGTGSGSSCGFFGGGNDEVYDDYIDGTGGRRNRSGRFLEKAPFGSAMDTPERMRGKQPGANGGAGPSGCGAGDYAFAAGLA